MVSERFRGHIAGVSLLLLIGAGAQGHVEKLLAKHGVREQQVDQKIVLDERVFFDESDSQGNLSGGVLDTLIEIQPASEVVLTGEARLRSSVRGGDPTNRVDLVVVGDGYTAGQLATYAAHAENNTSRMFSQPPFSIYQNYFNVHVVDVISPESGVDNDPTPGIFRNTAMDMAYWCSGTERLLCVSVQKAYLYANTAPDADLVLAIANSTKYGGAGYVASDLATSSGGHNVAPEIAIHEFGHALGNLADEYDYGGPETYSGPEPSEPNVSKRNAADMMTTGTKWAAWLGEYNPDFDGFQDTFEGGYYSVFGIYRPSINSKMRALNRPFNHASAEALIIEIYRIVDGIDSESPPYDQLLFGDETLTVVPLQPVGHSLDITWRVDGELIEGATGDSLDISTIAFGPGNHAVVVEVIDNTPLVRNEALRSAHMKDSRMWVVSIPVPCVGDVDSNRVVNVNDISYVVFRLGRSGEPGTVDGDADGNGIVDVNDISVILSRLIFPECE